jgi:hypothetical protein
MFIEVYKERECVKLYEICWAHFSVYVPSGVEYEAVKHMWEWCFKRMSLFGVIVWDGCVVILRWEWVVCMVVKGWDYTCDVYIFIYIYV